MNPTTKNICPRCNGKGYLEQTIVMDGKCFLCDGYGDNILAKEIRKQKEQQSNTKWINDLKQEIAMLYKQIESTKSEKRKEHYRKEAKQYYNTLKKQFNIILSLEEIKQLAKEINHV